MTAAALKAKLGVVPSSLLRIHRGELSRRIFHYSREQGLNSSVGPRAEKAGGIFATHRLAPSGKSGRSAGQRFSIMPPELVDFFVRYYAKPGDTYLDPFMGQGVRMQVAKLLGLHYRGTDVCRDFVRYIESVRAKIDDGTTTIQALECDARFPVAIPDDCGDFGFTSPPYWDLEHYGDEPEQLGVGHGYDDFLAGMGDVASAWLPKFRAGAPLVVNVNDFRKNGAFYPYHSDLVREFVARGWIADDLWIVDGLVSTMPRVFAGSFVDAKVAPKIHEYALVFRKP